MASISSRLRKPLAVALAGTVFAAAWAVRGGPTWFLAIVIEVGVVVRVITVYLRGGEDSDEGALAGSRADERQKLLSLRSRALAGNAAMIAAFAGLAGATGGVEPARRIAGSRRGQPADGALRREALKMPEELRVQAVARLIGTGGAAHGS